MGYSGVNLYNNGFAGGIVSIVVYPVFVRIFRMNRYAEPSPGSPAALRQQAEMLQAQSRSDQKGETSCAEKTEK